MSLIERARSRSITGYVEMHHIVPRCMGGTNDASNLVPLPPEEHYIAHLLLVRVHPDVPALIYAANMMANRSNKAYGWVRRRFAEQLSQDRLGFKHTDVARAKMALALTGVSKTDAHRAVIAAAHTKEIEYNGFVFFGWNDLKARTGISRHLYQKYIGSDIDPFLLIGKHNLFSNTSPTTAEARRELSRKRSEAHIGKHWFNNGTNEVMYLVASQPTGWKRGRLPRSRGSTGKFE